MQHENHEKQGGTRYRFLIAAGVFGLLIGAVLLFEHRAHIPNDYIFVAVILGLCIGMHFFMHGGHGGHGGHEAAPDNDNRDKK